MNFSSTGSTALRILAVAGLAIAGIAGNLVAAGDSDRHNHQIATFLGGPGHEYWQQKVDYVISVKLDDKKQYITGDAQITYNNNSPYTLNYLWFQLDQNRFSLNSVSQLADATELTEDIIQSLSAGYAPELGKMGSGGYRKLVLSTIDGNNLQTIQVGTLMRVNLPKPLKPEDQITIEAEWEFPIIDAELPYSRGGFEHFPDDDNYLYGIAQWYPRPVAFSEEQGWHTQPYLGKGEFASELGDFEVNISVPKGYIVAATGQLTNPKSVLSGQQLERLSRARTSQHPVFIVTPEEALLAQQNKYADHQVWTFTAKSVRDFAFAASRKFIWDAMSFQLDDSNRSIMAMSFYPNDAGSLWPKLATRTLVKTLSVLSKKLTTYPYPTIQAVNGPIKGGIEYPMITFNGPRPEAKRIDGVGDEFTNEHYLTSLLIHETIHSYFPGIINIDERSHGWVDEGLTSLYQTIVEKSVDPKYPSLFSAQNTIERLRQTALSPVVEEADNLRNVFDVHYIKASAHFSVLRNLILGPELFDISLQEFSRIWSFRRPTPEHLFLAIESASGKKLDWFWDTWFKSSDTLDFGIKSSAPLSLSGQNSTAETGDLTYQIEIEKLGGLVAPLPIRISLATGKDLLWTVPVDAWRLGNNTIRRSITVSQPAKVITLDPDNLTLDINQSNNSIVFLHDDSKRAPTSQTVP
ncbi:M1 family metallopeptidase [Kordiimonas lacus]|uniref:Peptidase M1 membrane alanine aminopeptidase domain-containing protein n=1 Tax=Kordiimonas lacus TaxID=637679 RepID=A0A1G7F6M7_9PROT|nr:M1 family metallopeptidase [Kordiimonas lacus]SDE71265.1 hypothetical protein SAMN04488071_3632 [Kordiimonas lacus]